MKLLNEDVIKNKFVAKLKVLLQLLKSGRYIVISIDRNLISNKENVNFQFNVSDKELEFYVKNLVEFRKRSNMLVKNARDILKN